MTYDNDFFEKYVINFDWTNFFEDAESINILVVSKEQNIHRFHIRCALFEKNPKGQELVHHIMDTINYCINIPFKCWLAYWKFQASRSKTCLNKTKESCDHSNPINNWSCSHTLINTGKKMTEVRGCAEYAERFRKFWKKIIH